jgi:hypothetical protein
MKHTPGPWKVYVESKHHAYIHAFREGLEFSIGEIYETAVPKELKSNARLIAAAPELLGACKALLAVDDELEYPTIVAQARAAIAKAEGG